MASAAAAAATTTESTTDGVDPIWQTIRTEFIGTTSGAGGDGKDIEVLADEYHLSYEDINEYLVDAGLVKVERGR